MRPSYDQTSVGVTLHAMRPWASHLVPNCLCRRARQVLSSRSWTHSFCDAILEEEREKEKERERSVFAVSPRGDTQRPNAFQRARILCCPACPRTRGRFFLFRVARDKDCALREGDRLVTKRHSLVYYMLEYRYTELILSILLENVSDSKSRIEKHCDCIFRHSLAN